MKEDKVLSWEGPAELDAKSPLEQLISEGARKLLQAAIEQEIEDYLQAHRGRQRAEGRASVVRNGHLPERHLNQRRRSDPGSSTSGAAPGWPAL